MPPLDCFSVVVYLYFLLVIIGDNVLGMFSYIALDFSFSFSNGSSRNIFHIKQEFRKGKKKKISFPFSCCFLFYFCYLFVGNFCLKKKKKKPRIPLVVLRL